VRDRVLEGVAEVLGAGDDLTFAKVARAAGVPERTVYRHFPTREALLTAVFDWANRRIGFDGERPADGRQAAALVRRVFPAFDELAPIIRELLIAPEGQLARLSDNERRQQAALAVVDHEAPGLDPTDRRRVAAVVQLLTAAATWQTLRDYWGMDGAEAGEAAALALELVLGAARTHASTPT
jgi:AcrR family transcriptional regulator